MPDPPRIKQFADLISRTTGKKPAPYNRRWHFDEDNRRHHGRRAWDPSLLEALVSLAATLDGLYPPDWSDEDAIRWRGVGASRVLAEIATDDPAQLRLLIHACRDVNLAPFRKAFGPALRKLPSARKPQYLITVARLDDRKMELIGRLMRACLEPARRSTFVPTRSAPQSDPAAPRRRRSRSSGRCA